MERKQIRSGWEIIEEFLTAIEADPSIDRETIDAIKRLWQEDKLNPNRLQQQLEKVREARLKGG